MQHATRQALAAAVLALAAPAAAQTSDAEVRSELELARRLAADGTSFDLAEQVLRGLEQGGVSDGLASELALARCEVLALGAEGARTAERRNALFERALAAYAAFLPAFPHGDRRDDAERGYVGVSARYARSLALALEDAAGEEAQRLRERRQDVLAAAVVRTGGLIAELKRVVEQGEGAGEAQRRELFDLMLDRGRMLLEIGRAQPDGTSSFEQSLATLEDLVFTAGDGTPYALRAYAVMGENLAAQGRWEEAAVFFEEVVGQAIPLDREEWRRIVAEGGLTRDDQELRWLFVQLGTQGLIDALLGAGRSADAAGWALHLVNTQRRAGFAYEPVGYASLLAGARALLDAGGWIGGSIDAGEARWFATAELLAASGDALERSPAADLALRIAETVSRDNAGNTLQVRAQRLIARIVDQPGVAVSPEVLLEAALGAYGEREHGRAADGFRRVLGAIDGLDEATQLHYAPKALYHLGRSLHELGRPREAAAAFQEGCTRYRGDAEQDEKNAQAFYNCALQLAQDAPGDASLQALLAQAEDVVAQVGAASAGLVVFRQAEQLRDDEQWAQARAKYRAVPETEPDHEKALVFGAYCAYREGDAEAALAAFTDYLERYVADPARAASSPARLQRRQEARAAAAFYRAYILNERAAQGRASWQDVVDQLDGFVREFPDQTDMAPFAERLVVLAQLELGRTEEARARLAQMIQAFPADRQTGYAAIAFYSKLEERHRQAREAGDVARARALLREMAELMRLGNDNDPTPDWPNLRRESSHWLALGEHAEAERVLKQTLAAFSVDPGDDEATRQAKLARAGDLEQYVQPDLAQALLEQQKTSEALALLDALVAGADGRPTKAVAARYARAAFGWVQGDREPLTLVPGAGADPDQLQQAAGFLIQIANGVTKYSCEWIELKLQLAYAYYVWGQQDSRHLDTARGQVWTLEQDFGAGFDDVATRCREDGDAPRGQALRRSFAWLKDKLE